jgi:hypothetical protein
MGQGLTSHSRVVVRAPQARPEFLAARVMVRVAVWVPLPQEVVQADQTDQALVLQSSGQRATSHAFFSVFGRQTLPPYMVGAVMVRVRVLTPTPQVTEQVDHAVKLLCSQSRGQC